MASLVRIVAGTYEGLLYGWEMPTTSKKMKLTFGYAAHAECIKSVAFMTAKQGRTLISGGNDEPIKYGRCFRWKSNRMRWQLTNKMLLCTGCTM